MKKNLFYSVMALCMAFFASCSQEEIVSTNGGGDNKVRLSVNVSGAQPNTRATQSLDVEGYVMRCIAQAVNADGTLIDGFSQTVSVVDGTAHFEFEAPEGAANYLFWADYVSGSDYTASNSAFYDAEDLTAVGYRLNQSANLFNNQAADAFCGSVAADNITGNVTLKRPFTRLAVRQSQVESMGLTGLTNIIPNINAGTDYNVYSKATATKASIRLNAEQNETLTALTSDKDADFYFFCYAFAAPAAQRDAVGPRFDARLDFLRERGPGGAQEIGCAEELPPLGGENGFRQRGRRVETQGVAPGLDPVAVLPDRVFRDGAGRGRGGLLLRNSGFQQQNVPGGE